MGLLKKIKRRVKKSVKGIGKLGKAAFNLSKDVALDVPLKVLQGDLSGALKEPLKSVKPLIGGPSPTAASGTPAVPDLQASVEEKSRDADRAERVRRARLARRGGTISTSSLGSPLSGVGLSRPTLGSR